MNKFDNTSIDAVVWAKEFMRIYNDKHQAEVGEWIDESLMIGWFANAIMAGHDHVRNTRKEISLEDIMNILKMYRPVRHCEEVVAKAIKAHLEEDS